VLLPVKATRAARRRLLLGLLGACLVGCGGTIGSSDADGGGLLDGAARADGEAGTGDAPSGDGSAPVGDAPVEGDAPEWPASDLYVEPAGDDSAPGTIDTPLRTIQRCATRIQPGFKCVIRAGVYPESVVPARSGTAGAPITFTAYPGETVVLSGADPVAGSWTTESGNVKAITVDLTSAERRYENQVFVDGAMWIEARWPDLSGPEQLLSHDAETAATSGAATSSGGTLGFAGLPPGCAGDDLVGATVRVRGGVNWWAHSGSVTQASAGSITYAQTSGAYYSGMYQFMGPNAGSRFYVTGNRCLLNAASEWHYDAASHTLRLWMPSGDPSGRVLAKMRDWAFKLEDRSFIVIDGIALFATSIRTNDASVGVTINKLKGSYLSHFITIANPWGGDYAQTETGAGLILRGAGHRLQNSELTWSAGNGIVIQGDASVVHNNKIEYVDYGGVYAGAIHVTPKLDGTATVGMQLTNNSLSHAGRDGIKMAEGCPDAGGTKNWQQWTNGRIAFNEISHYGALNQDVGGLYIACFDGYGSHVDHNRVHDGDCRGTRGFQGAGGVGVGAGIGFYFDMSSKNFNLHHNVGWNNYGGCIGFNGDHGGATGNPGMMIANNTCGSGNGSSFTVTMEGSLAGTYVMNNIFQEAVKDSAGNSLCYTSCGSPAGTSSCQAYGLGGSCNYTQKPSPGYRDESTWCDYHLAAGSPAINSGTSAWTDTSPIDNVIQGGTDFGAYESGGLDWTPGATCAGTGYVAP
jgi:hypothetical protein